MPDTRDIAIRADEKADAVTKRVDAINGQIGKLADQQERLRKDLNRALYGVGGSDGGLVGSVNDLHATVSRAMKMMGVIVTAAVSIAVGVIVYQLTHHPVEPQQTAPSHHGRSETRTSQQSTISISSGSRHHSAAAKTNRHHRAHGTRVVVEVPPINLPRPHRPVKKARKAIQHDVVQPIEQLLRRQRLTQ